MNPPVADSVSSTPQIFIPRSIDETYIADPEIRIAAIAKRRAEHDQKELQVRVCVYLEPAEMAYVPAAIQLRHLGSEQLDLPPLWGNLLTFTSAELQQYQTDWVGRLPLDQPAAQSLKAKLSQSGTLPSDISGYAFYAAPVTPRIDDNLPQFEQSDRMVFNGDGMIYRLSLANGQPLLKTRLMKTPCYYADIATQLRPEYGWGLWPFLDGGMVRTSLLLGSRNQANTAFLVTKNQLIVTFDGARPTIIDPDSLEILEAVGGAKEWLGLIPRFLIPRAFEQLFEAYSALAHPVCDHSSQPPHSDGHDLYAVNYSQGLTLLNVLSRFRKWLLASFGKQGRVFTLPLGGFTDLIRYQVGKPLNRWRLYLPDYQPVIIEQAAHQMGLTEDYILMGDIAFELETSQIFGPFWLGHLLTRLRRNRWSKKIGALSQVTSLPSRLGYWLSSIFFQLVLPLPFANIYLVRRADLQETPEGLEEEPGFLKLPPAIQATKITLPREVAHFVVDYQNPDGIITLNATHSVGWDVTEWIGEFDRPIDQKTILQKFDRCVNRFLYRVIELLKPTLSVWSKSSALFLRLYNVIQQYQKLLIVSDPPDRRKKLRQDDLIGMSASPVDLNYLARYEIDGQTGTILKSTAISDPGSDRTGRNTWSMSVNTHRNLQREQATETATAITNLYLLSWGHSWEMVPQRIYLAYKDRNVRTLPIEAMDAIDSDKPMTLLRLDTKQMEIIDSFEFPIGYFARSPQFMPSSDPCPAGQDPSTHGYLCCTVLADDPNGLARDEFWVFHADDFKNKPIYRLSHPDVNLGLMIHSAWLPPERMATAQAQYPPETRAAMRRQFLERDYQKAAQQHISGKVEQLYTEVIEKYFIPQTVEEEVRTALKQDPS